MAAGVNFRLPAVILANDTNCPTVTVTPDSANAPAPGWVVIFTFSSTLAGESLGSVKPKSAAAKVYTASSSIVTVLLAPTGASLTAATVMLKDSLSVLTPPFAVPPLSTTVQVRLPLPLAPATVLYLRPCSCASVTVVLALTCVVPSASHRVVNAGIAVTV